MTTTAKKTFKKITDADLVEMVNQINLILGKDAYVLRFTVAGVNVLGANDYVGLFGEHWFRKGDLARLLRAYIKGLEAGQQSAKREN